MSTKSCLYAGTVYHKRYKPREHVLRYSVFSLLVDLAEIKQFNDEIWFFSHNRLNLVSLHDKDFGEFATETLPDYVARKLDDAGIHTTPYRVFLSCYPKVCGFVFNPLSLFYCCDENNRCFAVIHEVHNTFGERHAYVLPANAGAAISAGEQPNGLTAHTNKRPMIVEKSAPEQWMNQQSEKELFVSPFAHMSMTYRFHLNMPGERQVIVIHASEDNGRVITASYNATRKPLNSAGLAKYFFKIPMLTVKVVVGIHWEALRLWLKGVPLFKFQSKSID